MIRDFLVGFAAVLSLAALLWTCNREPMPAPRTYPKAKCVLDERAEGLR